MSESADLGRLVRACTTGQQLVVRARIVFMAGDGLNNLQIARELDVDDETPGHWRGQWLEFRDVPLDELSVAGRLAGAPRKTTRCWSRTWTPVISPVLITRSPSVIRVGTCR